ncbi:MAG: zinc-ribbon domain-containing protein [Myxococcota bacterium]
MIVTCEQCTTSFQLDEARIPSGGVRVRCSRCKHAFFLASPNESQAEAAAPDAVHSIAEEAAADVAAGVPEPSADLHGDTWDGLGGDPVRFGDTAAGETSPTEAMADAAPEPALDDLDEEEDWQFSEEVRIEGDDDLEDDFGEDFGGESSGELDFGGIRDFSEGFDESALSVEADDPSVEMPPVDEPEIANATIADSGFGSGLDLDGPTPPPRANTGLEDIGRDESIFGSVDDFSSLMEDDEPARQTVGSLAREIPSELDADAGGLGLDSNGGRADDLGDPESWDLIGSDDPGATGTLAGSPATAAMSAPVDAGTFFDEDAFQDTPEELDLASIPLATGPVGKAVRGLGWIAYVAAVIAVGFVAFEAEWARISPSLQTVSVGPITAKTLSSGWVETAKAGTLLRFEGEVRNTAAQPILASGVTISLLDATGERMAAAPVMHAGIPLSEAALRESAPEVLVERTASASRRFAQTPIGPGEAVRFEAIVAEQDLPEGASRALLEVAEPQGGQ